MPKNDSSLEYLLLEAESVTNSNSNFADPRSFSSSEYPNMSFYRYVNSINAFQDESFDLVFIDGRARSSCMLVARNKVKPGSYIMLDNSEIIILVVKITIRLERCVLWGGTVQ
jgi:hypothetical protein